jgi:hypothetical protein
MAKVQKSSNPEDSAAGIATGYGVSSSPDRGQDFVPLHVVQTGSGAHAASYPMGIGGSFPGGEAIGA